MRHIACILCVGQNLQFQLANENDIQSNTVIKQIVLRIFFNEALTIAVMIGSILLVHCIIKDLRKREIRSKFAVPF